MKKTTILIIAVLVVIGGALYYSGKQTLELMYPEDEQDIALNTFKSEKELTQFLESAQDQSNYGLGIYMAMPHDKSNGHVCNCFILCS